MTSYYSTNNPYILRIVACLAIVGVLNQLRGSIQALESSHNSASEDQLIGAVSRDHGDGLQRLKRLVLPVTTDGMEKAATRTSFDETNADIRVVVDRKETTGETALRAPMLSQPKQNHQQNHEQQQQQSTHQQKKKPLNILILYPDDWRHDDIGGVAPVVKTPFLNQLARDGIRFTHNMVTTSICWVSRATLFTGQYLSRHKSYRLKTPEFYKTWHNTSWPALLQQSNYYTAHIGKWQYYDFDKQRQAELFNYTSIFEGKHQYPSKGGAFISAAEKMSMEVKTFLQQKRPTDQPFALTAAFFPPKAIGNSKAPGGQWFPLNKTVMKYYGPNVTIPHPYDETDSYKRLPWFFHRVERGGRSRWEERFQGEEKYQAAMKNYYSLITEVDEACKDIVDELERQGIANETLIIFTTDNGLFHAEHGLAGKWYPYQESIRVPLIIRDPRMPLQKHNTLDGSLTLNIDLHPTILGAAGITPPSSTQGMDMATLYMPQTNNDESVPVASEATDGDKSWRDEFFYEFPLDQTKNMPMSSAVVRKDLKFIYWPQFKYEQLFNLTEDPLELNDVWNQPQYASVLKQLQMRHEKWKEAVK
ncbi:Extracellular sulfatase Sulf [Seminavis robusta]|uniref:Extracellular sulfatase Sulf n=1 Tax=Seminavis robusta TaxID=568900 RepID=A0A9N8HS69_9STRA|nr:Extracellular sulfatase Sulf [Seminavis robusta]|eukprot:Sro1485_g276550.1 Extracellular sulfatase Sulf (589) ;mRNA; r:13759-15738